MSENFLKPIDINQRISADLESGASIPAMVDGINKSFSHNEKAFGQRYGGMLTGSPDDQKSLFDSLVTLGEGMESTRQKAIGAAFYQKVTQYEKDRDISPGVVASRILDVANGKTKRHDLEAGEVDILAELEMGNRVASDWHPPHKFNNGERTAFPITTPSGGGFGIAGYVRFGDSTIGWAQMDTDEEGQPAKVGEDISQVGGETKRPGYLVRSGDTFDSAHEKIQKELDESKQDLQRRDKLIKEIETTSLPTEARGAIFSGRDKAQKSYDEAQKKLSQYEAGSSGMTQFLSDSLTESIKNDPQMLKHVPRGESVGSALAHDAIGGVGIAWTNTKAGVQFITGNKEGAFQSITDAKDAEIGRSNLGFGRAAFSGDMTQNIAREVAPEMLQMAAEFYLSAGLARGGRMALKAAADTGAKMAVRNAATTTVGVELANAARVQSSARISEWVASKGAWVQSMIAATPGALEGAAPVLEKAMEAEELGKTAAQIRERLNTDKAMTTLQRDVLTKQASEYESRAKLADENTALAFYSNVAITGLTDTIGFERILRKSGPNAETLDTLAARAAARKANPGLMGEALNKEAQKIQLETAQRVQSFIDANPKKFGAVRDAVATGNVEGVTEVIQGLMTAASENILMGTDDNLVDSGSVQEYAVGFAIASVMRGVTHGMTEGSKRKMVNNILESNARVEQNNKKIAASTVDNIAANSNEIEGFGKVEDAATVVKEARGGYVIDDPKDMPTEQNPMGIFGGLHFSNKEDALAFAEKRWKTGFKTIMEQDLRRKMQSGEAVDQEGNAPATDDEVNGAMAVMETTVHNIASRTNVSAETVWASITSSQEGHKPVDTVNSVSFEQPTVSKGSMMEAQTAGYSSDVSAAILDPGVSEDAAIAVAMNHKGVQPASIDNGPLPQPEMAIREEVRQLRARSIDDNRKSKERYAAKLTADVNTAIDNGTMLTEPVKAAVKESLSSWKDKTQLPSHPVAAQMVKIADLKRKAKVNGGEVLNQEASPNSLREAGFSAQEILSPFSARQDLGTRQGSAPADSDDEPNSLSIGRIDNEPVRISSVTGADGKQRPYITGLNPGKILKAFQEKPASAEHLKQFPNALGSPHGRAYSKAMLEKGMSIEVIEAHLAHMSENGYVEQVNVPVSMIKDGVIDLGAGAMVNTFNVMNAANDAKNGVRGFRTISKSLPGEVIFLRDGSKSGIFAVVTGSAKVSDLIAKHGNDGAAAIFKSKGIKLERSEDGEFMSSDMDTIYTATIPVSAEYAKVRSAMSAHMSLENLKADIRGIAPKPINVDEGKPAEGNKMTWDEAIEGVEKMADDGTGSAAVAVIKGMVTRLGEDRVKELLANSSPRSINPYDQMIELRERLLDMIATDVEATDIEATNVSAVKAHIYPNQDELQADLFGRINDKLSLRDNDIPAIGKRVLMITKPKGYSVEMGKTKFTYINTDKKEQAERIVNGPMMIGKEGSAPVRFDPEADLVIFIDEETGSKEFYRTLVQKVEGIPVSNVTFVKVDTSRFNQPTREAGDTPDQALARLYVLTTDSLVNAGIDVSKEKRFGSLGSFIRFYKSPKFQDYIKKHLPNWRDLNAVMSPDNPEIEEAIATLTKTVSKPLKQGIPVPSEVPLVRPPVENMSARDIEQWVGWTDAGNVMDIDPRKGAIFQWLTGGTSPTFLEGPDEEIDEESERNEWKHIAMIHRDPPPEENGQATVAELFEGGMNSVGSAFEAAGDAAEKTGDRMSDTDVGSVITELLKEVNAEIGVTEKSYVRDNDGKMTEGEVNKDLSKDPFEIVLDRRFHKLNVEQILEGLSDQSDQDSLAQQYYDLLDQITAEGAKVTPENTEEMREKIGDMANRAASIRAQRQKKMWAASLVNKSAAGKVKKELVGEYWYKLRVAPMMQDFYRIDKLSKDLDSRQRADKKVSETKSWQKRTDELKALLDDFMKRTLTDMGYDPGVSSEMVDGWFQRSQQWGPRTEMVRINRSEGWLNNDMQSIEFLYQYMISRWNNAAGRPIKEGTHWNSVNDIIGRDKNGKSKVGSLHRIISRALMPEGWTAPRTEEEDSSPEMDDSDVPFESDRPTINEGVTIINRNDVSRAWSHLTRKIKEYRDDPDVEVDGDVAVDVSDLINSVRDRPQALRNLKSLLNDDGVTKAVESIEEFVKGDPSEREVRAMVGETVAKLREKGKPAADIAASYLEILSRPSNIGYVHEDLLADVSSMEIGGENVGNLIEIMNEMAADSDGYSELHVRTQGLQRLFSSSAAMAEAYHKIVKKIKEVSLNPNSVIITDNVEPNRSNEEALYRMAAAGWKPSVVPSSLFLSSNERANKTPMDSNVLLQERGMIRGSISLSKDMIAKMPTIKLVKGSATISTFLHETVHWLNNVNLNGGPTLLEAGLGAEGYSTLMNYATDGGKTSDWRTIEERIAESIEQYFGMSADAFDKAYGNASNVLSKLARMVRRIWRSIVQSDPTLPPEVVAVYSKFFIGTQRDDGFVGPRGSGDAPIVADLSDPGQLAELAAEYGVDINGELLSRTATATFDSIRAKSKTPELMSGPISKYTDTGMSPDDYSTVIFGTNGERLIDEQDDMDKAAGPGFDLQKDELNSYTPVAVVSPGVFAPDFIAKHYATNKGDPSFLAKMISKTMSVAARIRFHGLAPKSAAMAKEDALNKRDMIETALVRTMGDINASIDKEVGSVPFSSRARLRLEINKNMNDFLSSRDRSKRIMALHALPRPLRRASIAARHTITALSNKLVADGVVFGDLAATFRANRDFYVHRTYDLPKELSKDWVNVWASKPQNAAAYNRILGEMISKGWVATDKEAKAMIMRVASKVHGQTLESNPFSTPGGVLSRSLTDEHIEVFGEIIGVQTSFEKNFMNSVRALVKVGFEHELQANIRDTGLKEGWIKRVDEFDETYGVHFMGGKEIEKLGGEKTPIPVGDNMGQGGVNSTEAMQAGPLFGYASRPEIVEWFNEMMSNEVVPSISPMVMRLARNVNGTWKLFNTVYNHPTALKNYVGGAVTYLAQGNLYGGLAKAAQLIKAHEQANPYEPGQNRAPSDTLRRQYDRLNELGVIDSGALRDIMDLFRDSQDFRSLADMMIVGNVERSELARMTIKGLRTADKVAKKFYQYGDSLFKMAAYLNEVDSLTPAFPNASVNEIERMAADRTIATSFSFSREPYWIRNWKRNAIPFGNFFSFGYGITRAGVMNFAIGIDDVRQGLAREKAGDTAGKIQKAMGIKRLVSMSAASAGVAAAAMIMNRVLGWDDDKREAVNTFIPEFDRNGTLLFLGEFVPGENPKYINLSGIMPFSYAVDGIAASADAVATAIPGIIDGLMNGDNVAVEKAEASAFKALGHFFGPWTDETSSHQVLNAIAGRDQYGNQLWGEGANMFEKLSAATLQITRLFTPGEFKSLARADMIPVFGKEAQLALLGKVSNMNHKTAYMMGVRVGEVNLDEGIARAISGTMAISTDAKGELVRSLTSKNEVHTMGDIEKMFQRHQAKHARAILLSNMVMTDASTLGVDHIRMVEALSQASPGFNEGRSVSKGTAQQILLGQYREDVEISNQTIRDIIEASEIAKNESRIDYLRAMRDRGLLRIGSGR